MGPGAVVKMWAGWLQRLLGGQALHGRDQARQGLVEGRRQGVEPVLAGEVVLERGRGHDVLEAQRQDGQSQ